VTLFKKLQTGFEPLRVLDAGRVPVDVDRMDRVGKLPDNLQDGRLASEGAIIAILIRTIHRHVNRIIQETEMLPHAGTRPKSLTSTDIGGIPRRDLVAGFIHDSHRSYWHLENIDKAIARVNEAKQTVFDVIKNI